MFVSDDDARKIRLLRILSMVVLIINPIIFLSVAYILSTQADRTMAGGAEFVSYILLLVAVFAPFALPLIEKSMINGYKKRPSRNMTAGQLFFSITLMKLAVVEATYIYGLIVVMTGDEFSRMLWFYPIGILWSFIVWPRKEHFTKLLERLDAP